MKDTSFAMFPKMRIYEGSRVPLCCEKENSDQLENSSLASSKIQVPNPNPPAAAPMMDGKRTTYDYD